jgi:hypothetical protein
MNFRVLQKYVLGGECVFEAQWVDVATEFWEQPIVEYVFRDRSFCSCFVDVLWLIHG